MIHHRDDVEHFVEGKKSWLIGWLGFFSTVRGLIPGLVVTVLTMGVPFWWPMVSSEKIGVPFWLFVAIPIVGAVFFLSFWLFFLGRQARYVSEVRAKLHKLAHLVRDEHYKVHVDENFNFREYTCRLCNAVRDYFQISIKDRSIQAVIRLAIIDKNSSKIVYKTTGRSDGLNPKRDETSEDIAANEGIPAYLINQDRQGILIYNDIRKSSEKIVNGVALYKMTKNDKKYPDEILTMMVAPLNAWSNGGVGSEVKENKGMIGLLYVTSRKMGVFQPSNVDSMSFVADIISTSISSTVEIQKNKLREVK